MKKFCKSLLPGLMVLTFGSSTAMASTGADSPLNTTAHHLSLGQIASWREHMSTLGIGSATQDKLIQKVESGQLLDSQNPSLVKSLPHLSLQNPTVYHVFPDGSVYSASIKVLWTKQVKKSSSTNTVSPMAGTIGGGTVNSGSGYETWTGVTVSASDDVLSASFNATYEFIQGSPAQIDSIWGNRATYYAGSISNTVFQITRKYSQYGMNIPAEALYQFDCTPYNHLASTTEQMWLEVYDTYATEEDDFSGP